VKCLAVAYSVGLLALLQQGAARADEFFGGLYSHDSTAPPTRGGGVENGADVMIGWRGERIGSTSLQPHGYALINSAGNASFAVAGLSVRFGDRLFVRPAIGIGVHSGSASKSPDDLDDEIEFGSRFLFAPEIAAGVQLNSRFSAEVCWIHLSHAQIFSRQNPGIDDIGIRLNFSF
jgi:hypothetical protein